MLTDLRFAARLLVKSPGFTVAAALVLAVGIGANTAVFSLVHTLLFRAPAYQDPAQVVQVFSQDKKNPQSFRPFSYPTYRDIRAQNTVFSGLLAHNFALVGLGEKSETRRAFAATVSSNYFSVLGVAPILGRGFRAEEETPGARAQVAVVSYNYWKKHGLKPEVLGSTLLVNSQPFTVIGVMPEGFTGTMQVVTAEVWLPLSVYDIVSNDFRDSNHAKLAERSNTDLLLIGRLKPGLTAATAAPALATLATNLARAYPVEQKDQGLLLGALSRFSTSTSPQDDSSVSRLGILLLAMAGVVLLVACLNLANMLLARGTARRKEIAVRLALGGGRGRIIRQLLTEGLLLSLVGGVGGLVLALWSSDLLVASLSRNLPVDIVWSTGPSLPLLAAAFGFCLLATLCFAIGPALKLSRGEILSDLKEHAGEDSISRRRWKFLPRNPLVVVQIALSLTLLTAAALFIRGASKAGSVETGVQSDGLLLVELDSQFSTNDETRARQSYDRLAEKFSALPGVRSASVATTVPFGMTSNSRRIQRAGIRLEPDAKPATAAEGRAFTSDFVSVGADYFRTAGLPLLRGRAFTALESTGEGRAGVAIIDEVLARKLWPDGDALGQRVQYPGKPGAADAKAPETFEIVGIVPAVRTQLFDRESSGAFYLPFARGYKSNAFFLVKFSGPIAGREAGLSDLLRHTVREVDSALPILSVRSFAQHLDSNIQLWLVRAGAAMFSVFGGLALGLAVVGVYGVKAYSVARRTREIGIRMALGARPETVQWMVLREGLVMLAAGLGLGLLLAIGTGRLLSNLLYQVGALDPIAFTLAPLALGLAALLACWLPARRATHISPMTALRTE